MATHIKEDSMFSFSLFLIGLGCILQHKPKGPQWYHTPKENCMGGHASISEFHGDVSMASKFAKQRAITKMANVDIDTSKTKIDMNEVKGDHVYILMCSE